MAFQADSIFWVEVEKIVPNPFQPRREFDEAKLKELAESVRMYGILQPLTVTRKEIENSDGSFQSEYELIAGERRLRASKLAGLQIVPVIIRDGEQTEQEKLELAIIENLQREDLNAVDRALAFRQLADVFGLSHGQVAKKVGRSREYVSNSIRLLALPDYMLDAIRAGDMSEGHARTLLMLNDRPEEQDVVFREILLKKLSVREVERIARSIAVEKVRNKELIDNNLLALEKQFTNTLGTRVSITKTDFGGRVIIDYFSLEDLESMLERMRRDKLSGNRSQVSDAYKDESKDTFVSDEVDEEMATLAELARATGLEPITPSALPTKTERAEELSVDQTEPAVAAMAIELVEESERVEELAVVEGGSDSSLAALEPAPANPVVIDTKSVVMEVPTVPVVEVKPTPNTVATETVASTPKKPSLRDQLASLLGNRDQATKAEPVVAAKTSVSQDKSPELTPAANVNTTPKTTNGADDSDLYSINQFGI